MKKKVSVIIPVYNVEKYIRRCLESIAGQDFQFFEAIIINDGSPDNCQLIIDEFLRRYPRIFKCINIKNSGVANARNVGIVNAEGEYIAFVDSDDYISDNMLSVLYSAAYRENADIVVGGYVRQSKYRNSIVLPKDINDYPNSVANHKDLLVQNTPYIWNKLFKKNLIENNQIQFQDLRIFEDLLFTYECLLTADRISAVNEIIYHYIVGSSNSVSSNYSEKMSDIFLAAKALKEFCKEKDLYEKIESHIVAIVLNHIFLRLETPVKKYLVESQMEFLKESFKFLDNEFSNWRENEVYFRLKNKNKKLYLDEVYWYREIHKMYCIRKTRKYFTSAMKRLEKRRHE